MEGTPLDKYPDTVESENLAEEVQRLRLENKKLSRQLNLANDNITKYKNATSARENLSAVITAEKSKQEKQLRVIMDNAPEIVILLDYAMNLMLASQSFLNLAGVPSLGFLHHKTFRQVFSSLSDDT